MQPGVVYTTFHFPASGANVVTTDNSDWATNCPEYKVTAVEIVKVESAVRVAEAASRVHGSADRVPEGESGRQEDTPGVRAERLVAMANDIGAFFNAEPDKAEAAKNIAGHLTRGSGIRACGARSWRIIGRAATGCTRRSFPPWVS